MDVRRKKSNVNMQAEETTVPGEKPARMGMDQQEYLFTALLEIKLRLQYCGQKEASVISDH